MWSSLKNTSINRDWTGSDLLEEDAFSVMHWSIKNCTA